MRPPPVIFLDVDGVLHPLAKNHLPLHASEEDLMRRADAEMHMQSADRDRVGEAVAGEFWPPCMRPLADAVKRSGAEIVLSSTWRETLPQRRCVSKKLAEYGLDFKEFTPTVFGGRENEILEWLSTRDARRRWIAVDDLDLRLPEGHFVQIDSFMGFTTADADRVCDLLAAQDVDMVKWGGA